MIRKALCVGLLVGGGGGRADEQSLLRGMALKPDIMHLAGLQL